MDCADCGCEIPVECREDIDDTAVDSRTGDVYHDVGALYHCLNCGSDFRYLVHGVRRGESRLRRLGDDSDYGDYGDDDFSDRGRP